MNRDQTDDKIGEIVYKLADIDRQLASGELRTQVKEGVKEGLKELLKDEELIKGFWAGGYKELTTHSANNASQWIGKRILTAMVTALVFWGLAWLVTSGRLK